MQYLTALEAVYRVNADAILITLDNGQVLAFKREEWFRIQSLLINQPITKF